MAPAQTPAQAGSSPASALGDIKVEAGATGKIFKIVAEVGQSVKAGDPVLILEVMKMETSVVAPSDGVVASIEVVAGESVEAGALLATLK